MSGFRTAFFVLFILLAGAAGAKEIGPNVAVFKGQDLKWEDGAYSYHVMFKSLLANLNTGDDGSGVNYNPQADACLDQSTYALDMTKFPLDATIDRAFIVWTGAQPTLKLSDFTDNQIRLDFAHNENPAMNSGLDVIGRQSKLTDKQDFEFESIIENETVERGFFTYRVEVTDFFKELQERGRSLEISDGSVDGLSLYGDYTVSGLECTADAAYKDNSTMVSSWAIVLVFVSEEVTPKKLYLYDGFYRYFHKNSIIDITGFQFPDKPSIRLTLMVNEGDPRLVNTNTASGGSLVPESLRIRGAGSGYEQLFNTCNFLDQSILYGTRNTPFYYTEIFNSISSEFGFDATSGETCIGGTPPNILTDQMEYAIDVDTFYIDAAEEKWAAHFYKNGDQISLDLGANQDAVLTNFLMLSHDTRAGNYDIPNEDEKGFCSCAPEEGKVCFTQEFTYLIKVQNWGDDIVGGVKVQDTLPAYVTYVPGTTEVASQITEDAKGNWLGADWTPIPDGPGGEFPLKQPYTVADQMNYCELPAEECPGTHDRRLVRFKVKPKDNLPKTSVIDNVAVITDAAMKPYKTNTSIPLKLKSGTCLPSAECEEMDMNKCGGVSDYTPPNDDDVVPDADTGGGPCTTKNVAIAYAMGKNSPFGDVVIPNPSNNLTLGQFTVVGTTSSEESACTFDLIKVKVKVDRDTAVTLQNLKLVEDANQNGRYDNGENVVAETASLASGYADFDVPSTKRAFKENKTHYFVIHGDASVAEGTTITPNTTFKAIIEGATSIDVGDDGTPTVANKRVDFALYMFEPTGKSFIFSRGPKDPAVPATLADINANIPVLQLRTKSKEQANSIKSITFKVPSGSVLFGEGLEKVSVWLDEGGDGTADTMLGEGSAEAGEAEYKLTLATPIAYTADQEKYLIIKADFNLSGDQKGSIQVKKAPGTLDSEVTIYSLPIDSKVFQACTDPNDPNCQTGGDEEESGCGCSIVGSENAGNASMILSFLLGILLLIAGRRVYGDR